MKRKELINKWGEALAARRCALHDFARPCPMCEQRAMQAQFHWLASQPGVTIKSLVQTEPGKWTEQVWKVQDDGSRLLINERPHEVPNA